MMADKGDISLSGSSVTENRPRGRPRKPDALTNAQRQAAYRARQKATGAANKSVTVTKSHPDALALECARLRADLAQAQRALADTTRAQPHVRPSGGQGPGGVVTAVLARELPVDEAQSDDKRLAVLINGREFFSLERLQAHFGLARREVLERLLWWADRGVEQSLGNDDAAFNRYLNRVTKNR
ncbi:hypothetical protein CIW54_22765 [Paraburkholderia sp. T12-10]|nr:hypothetical protein CIW54_22765 [Paraburkholderia sp. T12-10]